MKRKGFTLIELLVVIAIIAMLLAILMPALSKVKKIAQRVVCATNLKGLGTAQTVYANDYEDQYAVQNVTAQQPWDTATEGFHNPAKTWPATQGITVGASLYLLVREADVSPKSFVCGAGGQTAYEGQNGNALDITELWDFGVYAEGVAATNGISQADGPMNHVSYSYQMPYGALGGKCRYAADTTRGASFAVMADKNPWYDPKLKPASSGGFGPQTYLDYVRQIVPYWERDAQRYEIDAANCYPHGREGQNVLFADGHASYEKTSDVGVKHDNIYTIQAGGGTGELPWRQGRFNDITYTIDGSLQPATSTDSWLVNDDSYAGPYHSTPQ